MSSFDEKILNAVNKLAGTTETNNPFKGKWISILGDFCSGYPGYIPDGASATAREGFDTVSTMWWAQLINKLEANLCVNYSSASMAVAGANEFSAAYNRFGTKLHQEAGKTYTKLDGTKYTLNSGVRNPDFIFIYLGVNDYTSYRLLGDYSDDVFKVEIPDMSTFTIDASTTVSTCYQILLNDIMTSYPDATIYCISPQTTQLSGTYPFLNKATTPWTMPELEELIRKLCMKFGARQIALSHYGIRGINEMKGTDGVISDATHLTLDAHKMIAAAIYNKMKKFPITWNTKDDV